VSEPEYRTQHVAQAPAGWHVRTIPSGEHWIRLAFPPGARRRGSGELVEILHPAGENPKQCNPAELVLLGNPSEIVRQGSRAVVISSNDKDGPFHSRLWVNAVVSGNQIVDGDATLTHATAQTLEGARKQARKMLGTTNPAELVILANPSRSEKLRAARERAARIRHAAGRNPEGETSETDQAVRLYQEFHGKDPKGIIEAQRSAAMRLDYVCLGPLLGLAPYVDGLKIPSPAHWDDGGYPVLEFEGVKLAANAAGTQLYAIEGDQDLSELLGKFPDVDASKDLVDLGPIAYVTYEARKSLDNFELVQYTHEFDEPRPLLGFDQVKREIFFVGGRYQVNAPGIEH